MQARAGRRCRTPDRGCRRAPAAGSTSLRKLSVPTRRGRGRGGRTPRTRRISSSRRHSRSTQLDLVRVDRLQAALLDVLDAGDQAGDAEHVRRAAFEEVRELASAASRWTSRRRCRPRATAAPCARGPTYSAPVPVGPSSDLWPGNASRSMCIACTSIGTTPAVWAASTRNSTSRSRAIRPISATGCTVPSTLLACVMRDEPRLRRDRAFGSRRDRRAAAVGRDARQGDRAGQFHAPAAAG